MSTEKKSGNKRGHISPDVVCPFYRRHDKLRILCDGFVPGTHMCMAFTSEQRRLAYIHGKCMDLEHYQQCPLYEALEKNCK